VQLLGVYSPDLCEKLARVLGRLGSLRALVVCGAGNVDELTVTGDTKIAELADGDTPEESAAILRDILGGAEGPKRNMLLLNGGAALYAAGTAPSLKVGVERAAELIDSGGALARLDGLIQFSQNVS
jgi:anthranilate phosphoribosyltransferase